MVATARAKWVRNRCILYCRRKQAKCGGSIERLGISRQSRCQKTRDVGRGFGKQEIQRNRLLLLENGEVAKCGFLQGLRLTAAI